MNKIQGQIVDIEGEEIFAGEIAFDHKIRRIERLNIAPNQYILPGFIDAHVHIESSMLTPAEFARMAVVFGTVATVSDPHEIANVLGLEGIKFMIDNGSKVNFKFHFGAPSCVPATIYETAGAEVTAADIETLFRDYGIGYLAEMMNWPGVLNNDRGVFEKLEIAAKYNAPVDGHAPGLTGDMALKYIAAGIGTDHECYSLDEALHKIRHGMKILIREGSAAKNFEALYPLINEYPDQTMFCSDDKHPDELTEGHINRLVGRSVRKGMDLFKTLKAACINPVKHYKLQVGLMREGDHADFIVVDNLQDFKVQKTYINGALVAENGRALIPRVNAVPINHFNTGPKKPEDFAIKWSHDTIAVIEARDQSLITGKAEVRIERDENGYALADPKNDLLKIAVVNRYTDAPPAVAFVRNFSLKEGAIASSVAHDSHNIIAVGASDEEFCQAINLIIENQGGICAVSGNEQKILSLPIAGLISPEEGPSVAAQYQELDRMAKSMGSRLSTPFMTLSFMALLVIPSLKISDKGLFDAETFEFVQ